MGRKKAVLFIYGSGGHKEQMKRLYNTLSNDFKSCEITSIGFSEVGYALPDFDINYSFFPFRDKVSYIKTIVLLPQTFFKLIFTCFKIFSIYKCDVLISTGPGLVLIPSLIYRMFNKKVLFLETWSRFYSKSATGKLMYKIASNFYIQNKELETLYEKAEYVGRL